MAMRTINPNDAYDKDNFINAMEDLGELEKAVQILPKDPWNNKARAKIGSLIRDDFGYYGGMSPDLIRSDADSDNEEYQEKIEGYSKTNFKYLLDILDDNSLVSILRRIPLVKVGNESLDKIVDAVEETHKVENAVRNRERRGIEDYIEDKVRGTKREVSFAYARHNEDYVQRAFRAYVKQAELDFQKAVSKEVEKEIKGKKIRVLEPDKNRLYSLIKESYEKVKSDKGEDSNELKIYHITIADSAYRVLKE